MLVGAIMITHCPSSGVLRAFVIHKVLYNLFLVVTAEYARGECGWLEIDIKRKRKKALSPVTKAEISKKCSDNQKTPKKNFDYTKIRSDLGQSVRLTTATRLV